MNRKKMLLAASAVVLVIGGVFAEKEINRVTPAELWLATGAGSIPGPGCKRICTPNGGTCTCSINTIFTTTFCGNQAAARTCGGTLRLLYANSNCTQPVYLNP